MATFTKSHIVEYLEKNHHIWEKYHSTFLKYLATPGGVNTLSRYASEFSDFIVNDPNVEMSEDTYEIIMEILDPKKEHFAQWTSRLSSYSSLLTITQQQLQSLILSNGDDAAVDSLKDIDAESNNNNNSSTTTKTTIETVTETTATKDPSDPTSSNKSVLDNITSILKQYKQSPFDHSNDKNQTLFYNNIMHANTNNNTPVLSIQHKYKTPATQKVMFNTLNLPQLQDALPHGIVFDLDARLTLFHPFSTETNPSPQTAITNDESSPPKLQRTYPFDLSDDILYKEIELIICGAFMHVRGSFLTQLLSSPMYSVATNYICSLYTTLYNNYIAPISIGVIHEHYPIITERPEIVPYLIYANLNPNQIRELTQEKDTITYLIQNTNILDVLNEIHNALTLYASVTADLFNAKGSITGNVELQDISNLKQNTATIVEDQSAKEQQPLTNPEDTPSSPATQTLTSIDTQNQNETDSSLPSHLDYQHQQDDDDVTLISITLFSLDLCIMWLNMSFYGHTQSINPIKSQAVLTAGPKITRLASALQRLRHAQLTATPNTTVSIDLSLDELLQTFGATIYYLTQPNQCFNQLQTLISYISLVIEFNFASISHQQNIMHLMNTALSTAIQRVEDSHSDIKVGNNNNNNNAPIFFKKIIVSNIMNQIIQQYIAYFALLQHPTFNLLLNQLAMINAKDKLITNVPLNYKEQFQIFTFFNQAFTFTYQTLTGQPNINTTPQQQQAQTGAGSLVLQRFNVIPEFVKYYSGITQHTIDQQQTIESATRSTSSNANNNTTTNTNNNNNNNNNTTKQQGISRNGLIIPTSQPIPQQPQQPGGRGRVQAQPQSQQPPRQSLHKGRK